MEKAVKEICNLKDFLLVLNENQSTALRLQIKLTWFNPNHSYLSQLDVTYKTPDLMSHFLPP
ncbi:oligohyaluronate lyase, partial [Streptococcus pneumoniae]|nr:oligohyaluronate lyase [Streptococcus pneumoniae]